VGRDVVECDLDGLLLGKRRRLLFVKLPAVRLPGRPALLREVRPFLEEGVDKGAE
jgi:hypothetical protein